MNETIEHYQRAIEDMQKSRKEILGQAKEKAEQLIQESNARIENTIRTIKESQAEKEKTKQARQELKDFRQSLEELEHKEEEEKIIRKMERLRERQSRKQRKERTALPNTNQTPSNENTKNNQAANIMPGSYVKLKGQDIIGQVLEIKGKNAITVFGNIKTTVSIERLVFSPTQPKAAALSTPTTFISTQTQDSMHEKRLHFKQDIDVRGMRGDEALQAVTYFIDDAILVGIPRVRILHGTGTGILRTLIRQYLQTVPEVRNFADEHVQFGGAGITVVDL